MTRKPEDPATAVARRPSMDFVGLAAALAFIAVGPSAAAVTERSADEFREGAFSPGASLGSSSFGADAGNAASFRLAQSTQCANPNDPDCNDEEYEDDSSTSSSEENQFGDFQFEYLPSDQNILEQWYDFQNEVDVDNIPNHWGPPYEHGFRTRMYGPGGSGVRCLIGGGAIMFSVKARRLGCWRPAKAPPVRGLKVPTLGPAAQRVLTSCRFSTGSVTLRNGAFACIATPPPVVRRAAKGAPVRPSPVRPSRG